MDSGTRIDVPATIAASNRGRRPDVLAQKYALMRADPFAFFRGSAPLFAADWAAFAPESLHRSPPAWLCGDAHLENFGTYRARRELVVFDLNDFDETWLGPALYDPARLIVSSYVWAQSSGMGGTDGRSEQLLEAYAEALRGGKPLWIDRDTATGKIRKLMQQVYKRDYATLLDIRTERNGKKRRLRLGKHALPVDPEQRKRACAAIAAFAPLTRDEPSHYEVLDVGWRIAGTGSLGVERYVVLVAGDGTPDGARLIDVKQAAPSSLAPVVDTPQPRWANEAERVVAGYRRLPCSAPSRVGGVFAFGTPFVVRRLQPTEDRLAWNDLKERDVDGLHEALGSLLGWAQLRSGGRDGSWIADAAIAFGNDPHWRTPLLEYAEGAGRRFAAYWQTFRSSGL